MDTIARSPRGRTNRRAFLGFGAAAVGAAFFGRDVLNLEAAEPEGVAPALALRRLVDGNARYQKFLLERPNQSEERRLEVSRGQHPFAAILACADSRVTPELAFDTGLGDLFVCRVAGNIATPDVIGSLEYGVEHLGIQLIAVVGHSACGAVSATVDAVTKGGHAPGEIGSLIEEIKRPVQIARLRANLEQLKLKSSSDAMPEIDLVDSSVRTNVQHVVAKLKAQEEILGEFMDRGKLQIVGMRYDLKTGGAELIA